MKKNILTKKYLENNIYFTLKKIILANGDIVQGIILPDCINGTNKIDSTIVDCINMKTGISKRISIIDKNIDSFKGYDEINIDKANKIYSDFIVYLKKQYNSDLNLFNENMDEINKYYNVNKLELGNFSNERELRITAEKKSNNVCLENNHCRFEFENIVVTNERINSIDIVIKKDLGKYLYKQYEHLFYEDMNSNKELKKIIVNTFKGIETYSFMQENISSIDYDGFLTQGDKESVYANLKILICFNKDTVNINNLYGFILDIENISNIITNNLSKRGK